jgi:tRNA G10  N-methylase Trm11
VKVQDIESYTKRDRYRPKRDPRVGMLPPKLAQVIINLAVGKLPEDKLKSICDIPADQTIPPPDLGQKILDPFCGTGVVIQESILMGYETYASDLEQRMIDYTKENITWLKERYPTSDNNSEFETADATHHEWKHVYDFVASEVYLGQPYNHKPTPEILAKNIANCNLIIKKFLQNIGSQINPGTRLCLAIPAWQNSPNDFKHLPLIDQISDLGYNLVSFEHVEHKDLIYYRADQIVARELLIITRK